MFLINCVSLTMFEIHHVKKSGFKIFFSVTQKCQDVTMCVTMIFYQLIWIAFGKLKQFSFAHQLCSSWYMHRKYRMTLYSINSTKIDYYRTVLKPEGPRSGLKSCENRAISQKFDSTDCSEKGWFGLKLKSSIWNSLIIVIMNAQVSYFLI